MAEMQGPSGSRRLFLKRVAQGAALAGLAGAAAGGAYYLHWSQNRGTGGPAGGRGGTPVEPTDPKLLTHEPAGEVDPGFERLRCLALAADGGLFVGGDQAVKVFGPDGAGRGRIGLESPPSAMDAGPDGLLYVATAGHVEVYDAGGRRQAAWPAVGPGAVLSGLAVAGERVYVADAASQTVVRCDRSGREDGRLDGRNCAAGGERGFIVPNLASPYFDVAAGEGGAVWVANPGRHRVEGYSASGGALAVWGSAGAGPDQFCGCCNPTNLAVYRGPGVRGQGFVTSEKGTPRVKLYDHEGRFVGIVAGVEAFDPYVRGLDVVTDPAGRVYVLDPSSRRVRVFRPKAAWAAGSP